MSHITNAIWVIIITLTTVGYGDRYPTTHFGRLIAAISCIFGLIVISLMVYILTDATSMNKQEDKAYNIIKIVSSKNYI
jgi:hypothetical protein